MTGVASDNRIVVVTEATDAIGEATAMAFAGKATTLLLAGRDLHGLAVMAERCRGLGAVVETVQAHVGDTASLRRLVNAARAQGRIDAWVSLEGKNADLQAALPLFLKQKRGVFVAVGDSAIPASVRGPLSARRDIHLCEIYAGSSAAEADKIAAAIVDVVRSPRQKTSVGANDGYIERMVRAGSAFAMTTLAGLGTIAAAVGQAKLG